MAIYNTNRTAYQRYWSENWYLIPSGKKRAPMVWMGDGPLLHTRFIISREHINLLTEKDRAVLLESINAGCFDEMWNEMQDVLRGRGLDNLEKLMRFVE